MAGVQRTGPLGIGVAVLAAAIAAGPAPVWCAPPSGGGARFAGRPLPDVLADLQALGLDLVYSTDLVRADMIVAVDPPVRAPRLLLDLILAPFGLAARNGPGGRILIVAAAEGLPPCDAFLPPPGGCGTGPPAPETSADAAGGAYRERVEVVSRPILPGGDQVEPRAPLTRERLSARPGFGGDPQREIARLPGLVSGDRSAAFGIRGSLPDDTLLLLDGMAIDAPYHLQEFTAFSSLIDARAIGGADVLTGVFPAEYGDRMGGVVEMRSVDPGADGRSSLTTSLIDTGFYTEGSAAGGDATWVLSARAWYPDATLDALDPAGEDVNPSSSDLFGKLQFRLPGGSIVAAHFLAGSDGLDYQSAWRDSRVRADDSSRYAWLTIRTPWTARLYSQTVLSRAGLAKERDGIVAEADGKAQVQDDRSSTSLGLRQDWSFNDGGRASLQWGIEGQWLAARYFYSDRAAESGTPSAGDETTALEPAGTETGVYAGSRMRVAGPLTLEAGLRLDRQSLTGDSQWSPRLNARVDLGPRTALRAGWGVFRQPGAIGGLSIADGVTRFLGIL